MDFTNNYKIRSQFPILETKVNENSLTYLDSAATSQKPLAIINTISEYYKTANANIHRGIYDLSTYSTRLWENSHKIVADFIKCKEDEVFFVRNTTEGLNAIADIIPLEKGDVVVVTEMEHHSNILPWQKAVKRSGAKLEWIPVLEDFTLDLDYLDFLLRKFRSRVKVVAITHLSNTLGTQAPIEKIVEMAHKEGTLVVVDGAQAVAHMPVNVKKLDCDFCVFSGHKLYAANGAGVVYGKRELLKKFEPFMRGGGMITDVLKNSAKWAELPLKFEAGTPDIASGVSLAAAILWLQETLSEKSSSATTSPVNDPYASQSSSYSYYSPTIQATNENYLEKINTYEGHDKVVDKVALENGWQEYMAHENQLVTYLLEQLSLIKKVRIFGPKTSADRTALVAFELKGIHAHDVAEILNEHGIAVRAGLHCTHPLHKKFNVTASVRVSFSIFNTQDEIDKLITALHEVISKFTK